MLSTRSEKRATVENVPCPPLPPPPRKKAGIPISLYHLLETVPHTLFPSLSLSHSGSGPGQHAVVPSVEYTRIRGLLGFAGKLFW